MTNQEIAGVLGIAVHPVETNTFCTDNYRRCLGHMVDNETFAIVRDRNDLHQKALEIAVKADPSKVKDDQKT